MSGMKHLVVAIPFCLLLAACGNHDDKVQEHVWQGQVDALDKAKGVEDMVKDAAEKQRQQMEEEMGKMQQR